ncbi:serine protein kinase RIO [Candidatus Altiarchaeota archaeon]
MDLNLLESRLFDVGRRPGKRRKAIGRKKVSQRVFDDSTLLTLYRLTNKRAFQYISGIVSTGKEANVFHAVTEEGEELAIKIYSTLVDDFKRRGKYIRGDPRFKVGSSHRRLIYEWARKEYQNLKRVHGKVDCPRPIVVSNNVLVMSFIGETGIPAPKLRETKIKDPEKYFKKIISMIKKMHSLGIVHGDLSEYNILNPGKPLFIDFSQGVVLQHQHALEFLKRDIENICKYFSKYGIESDSGKIYASIVK